MIDPYSPKNEIELAFIRSLLDGEKIPYYIRNDHFGSMEIGPKIPLFNAKMIMVHEDNLEAGRLMIEDFLQENEPEAKEFSSQYTGFDRLRVVLEFLMAGWIIPGKRRPRIKADQED